MNPNYFSQGCDKKSDSDEIETLDYYDEDLDVSAPNVFRVSDEGNQIRSNLFGQTERRIITDGDYEAALDSIAESYNTFDDASMESSDVKSFNNTMNDIFISFTPKDVNTLADSAKQNTTEKEREHIKCKYFNIALYITFIASAIAAISVALIFRTGSVALHRNTYKLFTKTEVSSSYSLLKPDHIRYSMPILLDFSWYKYSTLKGSISLILSECFQLKSVPMGKFLHDYYKVMCI